MSFAEHLPTPTPKNSLACRQHFFHHNNLLSGFFSPVSGASREHGSDHFSWLSSPAICSFGGKGSSGSAVMWRQTSGCSLRSRPCWLDPRCQSPPSGPCRMPHLRIPRSLLWEGNNNLGCILYTQTIPIIYIFFFKYSSSTQNKIFLS